MRNGYTTWFWLTSPNVEMDGHLLLDALNAGENAGVIDHAAAKASGAFV